MSETKDLQELQPEEVLRSFASTPLPTFLIVALVLHAILIFGSSLGYIHDTWIDPEGAKARAEAEKARNAPPPVVKPKKAAKPADEKPADKTGEAKPAEAKPADGIPEGAKDSQTVKDITSLPKPGETPAAPSEDKLLNLDSTR